jgi:nucleotide-binding universal stress UspA family protein
VKFYEQLEETAAMEGPRHDIAIRNTLVTGDEVEAIVEFLRQEKMDLLVVAFHRYTPRLAHL